MISSGSKTCATDYRRFCEHTVIVLSGESFGKKEHCCQETKRGHNEYARGVISRCIDVSVSVPVLAVDGPDTRLIFLEGIDVHHPVEDDRDERSAGGVTGFLSMDRSFQAE